MQLTITGHPGQTLRLVGRNPRPPRLIAPPTRCASRARANNADDASSKASTPTPLPPYTDALLAREYELWQRQAAMYERMLQQADLEQQRFAEERLEWKATEAALRQEAAELRAQLLYVLAQLNNVQAGTAAGQPSATTAASTASSSYMASTQQATIPAREPAAALANTSYGSDTSPAEQVKAVVDAMKASGGVITPQPPRPSPPPSTASSSSTSPVGHSAAWPTANNSELPAYAADLAAAVAAMDTTDVLQGVSRFQLQGRAAIQAAAAASSLATAQVEEEPVVAAPVEQPVAAAPSPPAAVSIEETPEADRGPPPALTLGADDIFWVNQLHTGLVELGYFPGDDDIDVYFFGEDTLSALMTMQCCEGLPETGVTDEATWMKLLGPELKLKPPQDLTADMMLNVPGVSTLGRVDADSEAGTASSSSSSSSSGNGGSSPTQQPAPDVPAARPAYTELFSAALSEVTEAVTVSQVVELKHVPGQVKAKVQMAHMEMLTEWPVLMDGDGGREVHALHVALEQAGYYPSEDDMRWWIFSDGTSAALKTCQACNSYPESGVCDAATWKFLLGPDATPADLLDLCTGDSADEDLAGQDSNRVWLMGEQRWEDRSRVRRS